MISQDNQGQQRPRDSFPRSPQDLLLQFLGYEAAHNRSAALFSCLPALAYAIVCGTCTWPCDRQCPKFKAVASVLVLVLLSALHAISLVCFWRSTFKLEMREIIRAMMVITRLLYLGCFVNFAAVAVCIWGFSITVTQWKADPLVQPFVVMFIIVALSSLTEAVFWTYKMLRFVSFSPEPLPDSDLFLFCRCACLPSKAKQAVLPSLFAAATILYSLALVGTRNDRCAPDLRLFVGFACAIFGAFSVLLGILYSVPRGPQQIVLLLLGLNSLLAFTWSVTGAVWTDYSSCDQRSPSLYRTAVSCKIVLFVSSTVFPFFAVCCKIERCFPARSVDSLSYHEYTEGKGEFTYAFSFKRANDTLLGSQLRSDVLSDSETTKNAFCTSEDIQTGDIKVDDGFV